MNTLLRKYNISYSFYNTIKKSIHYQKPDLSKSSVLVDNYGAHSPIYLSRGKIEEHRSRLFFEAPPVPHRIPKYLFLACIVISLLAGGREKVRKRQKMYLAEVEKDMHRKIVPFVSAMEDLRFTAIEQRNYMINKAIADQYSPALFEHLRKRFYQEDVFIQTPRAGHRYHGKPLHIQSQSILPKSGFMDRTMSDKGLFDNREIGYSQ